MEIYETYINWINPFARAGWSLLTCVCLLTADISWASWGGALSVKQAGPTFRALSVSSHLCLSIDGRYELDLLGRGPRSEVDWPSVSLIAAMQRSGDLCWFGRV